MKKVIMSIAVMIAAATMMGCSSGQSYCLRGYNFNCLDRVAIADISGELDEKTTCIIADQLAVELLLRGYSPMLYEQASQKLRCSKFDTCNLLVPEGAEKAGEILDVPAFLVIDTASSKDKLYINAKLICGNSGAVLWMGTGSADKTYYVWPIQDACQKTKTDYRLTRQAVSKIAQNLPKKCK